MGPQDKRCLEVIHPTVITGLLTMDLICLPPAAKPLAWDLPAQRVGSPRVLVIHLEQPNPLLVTQAPVPPQTPYHLPPPPPPVTVHPPPVTPCPALAPPPPTQSAAPLSPLGLTGSPCTTKRHNNQPSRSRRTILADERHRREVTLSKLKWRICSACMRLTTTRSGEPGWTSCSASWRSGAPPSASAPPSARTPSTSTGSTSSPRTVAASLSAPTRKPGRTLQPSWVSVLPPRERTP